MVAYASFSTKYGYGEEKIKKKKKKFCYSENTCAGTKVWILAF